MKPRPVRMPDELWESLQAEAEERGLGTAEYVRDLLRRRDAILQADTQADTQANTQPNTQARLDAIEQRLADLEDTVASSEAQEPSNRGESPTISAAAESAESGAHSASVQQALNGWTPGRGAGERREAMRAAGRAAVALLQEDGGPLQRGDFEDLWEAHPVPEQAPPNENDTYWRKSLRPALQAAIEAGLARQAEGSWEYYWEGPAPARDDVDDDRDRGAVDAGA